MSDPFGALSTALGSSGDGAADDVRVDPGRRRRTGAPEVVLAAGKSDEQIRTAIERLLVHESRVVVSRCTGHQLEWLATALPTHHVDITPGSSVAVLSRDGAPPRESGGRVACVSAGSSDVPVAVEAVVLAREMGCAVETAWDVGVAGLHRLVEPLRRIVSWAPDALIVAAGMDGVLPTVVAGLVDIPVIGLPVATGYGHGGGGEAALATMLQSCAPGVVVVNINNGVGAGIAAGKIARRAATARGGAASPGPPPP